MPRPRKCRTVCRLPAIREFRPVGGGTYAAAVILTVDEFETIRLIDQQGFSQEECGRYMEVARTTVQMIYNSARKKIADAMVSGLPLRIEGGDYQLCDQRGPRCGSDGCFRHRCRQSDQTSKKGDLIMKIAVTYENGQIFQHFGHTEQFKVYEIADGAIIASQVVDTKGSGHGALAGVLNAIGADVLICGGIGGGAQAALTAAGIRWYAGVAGDADQAVQALLSGILEYDPNATCHHHGEHHHDGECGSHGCGGEHHCGGHH